MTLSALLISVGALQLSVAGLIALSLLRRSPRCSDVLPSVTIVVPARNEAANLPRLFRSLAALEYDSEKLELILVDDESTDETKETATRFAGNVPFRVRVIDAQHGPDETLSPTKTLPLAQGIDVASGDLILMTDGDCEVQPHWVIDMVRHFESGVGLVCGITLPDYEPPATTNTRFEAVDWTLLLGVCAGMCRLGKPVALIGNNYAVRKQTYHDVGTFRSIKHNRIDDIALFRAVADSREWKIAFAVTPGSCARTLPVGDSTELVRQRYRWMEGFGAMKLTGKALFGFGMLTHLLWPIVLLAGGTAGVLTSLLIWAGDWAVIAGVLSRLKKRGLGGYAIVYPIYAVAYGWRLLLSILRRPAITWKDRQLA